MAISKDICTKLDDREIIVKSMENMDYFACLYDRYEPQMLRYIRKISFATPEEAGDILQDAFIKIWRNLNNYDPDMKLSSWLYRIVHNETISFCRKKRSFGKDRKVEPETTPLADRADDPEAGQDPDVRFLLTHQVLDQLPMKYREILVLKFLENMQYEEISDILKIPEGTVATRINRAKAFFRKIAKKENIKFNL